MDRQLRGIQTVLKQALTFAGIVATSVVATVLVLHALTPARATAQTGEAQSVRASEFVLVGPDGSTRARLGINGAGFTVLEINDDSGTLRGSLGTTPFGVALRFFDGNGTVQRMGLGTNSQRGPGLSVYASDGKTIRVNFGVRQDDSTAGFTVSDASGQPIATLP